MGLLLDTTEEAGTKIVRGGVLVDASPGLFQSSPLAQEVAAEVERWGHTVHVAHPWVAWVAGRFVSCAGVTDRRNCDALLWDPDGNRWAGGPPTRKRRPGATYHIAVTDPRWLAHLEPGMQWDSMAFDHHEGVPVLDPSWRTEDVRLIATGIAARLAFDGLPILADALEDAGCTDPRLLDHLRGPGPHCRGCWAIDSVLGREEPQRPNHSMAS
jgi:hypothetical protein